MQFAQVRLVAIIISFQICLGGGGGLSSKRAGRGKIPTSIQSLLMICIAELRTD